MLIQNKNHVEDYGGDYCNDLEELIPEFDSTSWFGHYSYQFDHFDCGSFADITHVRTNTIMVGKNKIKITIKDPTRPRARVV